MHTEELAKLFHDTYERLAPRFGYETRAESAVAWEDVPEANRRLMIATVEHVIASDVADVAVNTYLDTAVRRMQALVMARSNSHIIDGDEPGRLGVCPTCSGEGVLFHPDSPPEPATPGGPPCLQCGGDEHDTVHSHAGRLIGGHDYKPKP